VLRELGLTAKDRQHPGLDPVWTAGNEEATGGFDKRQLQIPAKANTRFRRRYAIRDSRRFEERARRRDLNPHDSCPSGDFKFDGRPSVRVHL
jgi:hypothetical protein